ncbi:hypothetical protein quinque_007863 [Culex quinquefasciatus]
MLVRRWTTCRPAAALTPEMSPLELEKGIVQWTAPSGYDDLKSKQKLNYESYHNNHIKSRQETARDAGHQHVQRRCTTTKRAYLACDVRIDDHHAMVSGMYVHGNARIEAFWTKGHIVAVPYFPPRSATSEDHQTAPVPQLSHQPCAVIDVQAAIAW